MDEMRNTKQLNQVMAAFVDDRPLYGWEIMQMTGLASGTVYPILARLEGTGYLDSEWEDSQSSRPRRRLYRLTDKGPVRRVGRRRG